MSTLDQDLAESGGTEDQGLTAGPRRRSARISQADVFAAADALLVMGERPTIDRVRMKLGRGSPNTINDHLDAWWAKLGARLRDLPGQEFPQLPERVAQTLQQLWNEALDGARAALQNTLSQHEQALAQQEHALQVREHALSEREHTANTRAVALEDSLSLAREQLTAANQRAERLELSIQQHDTEGARLRARTEELERAIASLRLKLEATETSHQAERARAEGRHAATEARWLTETDRARQALKEATKEHERQFKLLRSQADALRKEREDLRGQLGDTRSELKAANAIRAHVEERLRQLQERLPQRKNAIASRKRARRPVKITRGT
jgi:chromosome segregation ATPase